MIKSTLTAMALLATVAIPGASAQSPSGAQLAAPAATTTIAAPKAGFVTTQDANDWRGSKIVGASVYGPDNSSIGEINDVIIGSDGKIKAAVVGVGGFLGVSQKDVALSFDSLSITRKPNSPSIDKITVQYTKDELKNAPQFAYYQDPASTSTTGSGGTLAERAAASRAHSGSDVGGGTSSTGPVTAPAPGSMR